MFPRQPLSHAWNHSQPTRAQDCFVRSRHLQRVQSESRERRSQLFTVGHSSELFLEACSNRARPPVSNLTPVDPHHRSKLYIVGS